MANTTEKVFDLVNNLIEANRDSQQGYRDAAEKISDRGLRTFFNERSLDRGQYAGELQNEVHHLGKAQEVSNSGTAAGAVRRTWMDLKANLGGGDHAILSSLEAGEDAVKKAYEEAMRQPLPGNLASLVRTQAQNVFSAHDYIRSIRDRKAAA
jgi:uncharacterized protein (TIGR02284 family)